MVVFLAANRLVDDVFGKDNMGKVQMEKVVMLIWQFRDDANVIQFMAQFVAKVSVCCCLLSGSSAVDSWHPPWRSSRGAEVQALRLHSFDASHTRSSKQNNYSLQGHEMSSLGSNSISLN